MWATKSVSGARRDPIALWNRWNWAGSRSSGMWPVAAVKALSLGCGIVLKISTGFGCDGDEAHFTVESGRNACRRCLSGAL